MKQKKSLIIIVVSVIAVCLLGVIASQVFDWPVNLDQTSGNVAKSSRFSRKTAQEATSNMQELLLNDEDYKNGLVAAYLVMKTRAQQFGALVDMSEEVAGNIPEFKSVLKDMKAARPMVENVCTSMDKAGADLNAALGGETPKDLAQNTTNAALAYTTLQKQNSLATRFIDTADAYLAKTDADNRLKFVRDQWVEYQQLTAILENDAKAIEELEKKGRTLTADESLSTVKSFNMGQQITVISNSSMGEVFGVESGTLAAAGSVDYINTIANQAITGDLVANQTTGNFIANQAATGDLVANQAATGDLVSNQAATGDLVANQAAAGNMVANQAATGDLVANQAAAGNVVANQAAAGNVVANQAAAGNMVANQAAAGNMVANQAAAGNIIANQAAAGNIIGNQTATGIIFGMNAVGGNSNLMGASAGATSFLNQAAGQTAIISNSVSNFISNMATGNVVVSNSVTTDIQQ